MTDKMKKPRKEVKATLNKNRHKDIQELADIDVEDRPTKHKSESTRYQKILKNRKLMKKMRDDEKRSKIHIGKRKHIEKRARAEVEE